MTTTDNRQNYLTLPASGGFSTFVNGATSHLGPIVYVGEGSPGFFPQAATLNVEQAKQVRDALSKWIADVSGEQATEVTQ